MWYPLLALDGTPIQASAAFGQYVSEALLLWLLAGMAVVSRSSSRHQKTSFWVSAPHSSYRKDAVLIYGPGIMSEFSSEPT